MVKYFLMGLFVLNVNIVIVCSVSSLLIDVVRIPTLEEYDRQRALEIIRSYQEDQHSRLTIEGITPDEYFYRQEQRLRGKSEIVSQGLERIAQERPIR